MINFKNSLLKVLKLLKKPNANNKRSIKIFACKILHLKSMNNKKQVVKQNTHEFKYMITVMVMMIMMKMMGKLKLMMTMMMMMMMMMVIVAMMTVILFMV